MLIGYQYIFHKLETMQEFIDDLFCVWLGAVSSQKYNLTLFNHNKSLKSFLDGLYFSEYGESILSDIELIYYEFKKLSQEQKNQLKIWYENNNNIQEICQNPQYNVVRYEQLKNSYEDLGKLFKSFYGKMYSTRMFGLVAFKEHVGEIKHHYDTFMDSNTMGICPFCGLHEMKTSDHSYREAYDHYLPKSIYPFNSINFYNLVPTCNECNSAYKQEKDTLFDKKNNRRKVFYPYDTSINLDNLELSFLFPNSITFDQLTPNQVTLKIDSKQYYDEVNSWIDIYGIDERYRAVVCKPNNNKPWLRQIKRYAERKKLEGIEASESIKLYLSELKEDYAEYPLTDKSFLKYAFLESCNDAGLFTS